MNPTKALPGGLTLHTRDECLEVVSSATGDVRLLAVSDGLEFIKGTLDQGQRLHLYPSEDPSYQATEVYFLLHGSLSYETEWGPQLLAPDDYIVVQGLETATVFTAVTDIEFLYLSSQPSFHEISASLKDLRSLAEQLATKDAGETIEHCRRIRDLSMAMGRTLGLPPHRLHLLDYAAHFHDVGKLEVPARILRKPGPLTPAEWAVIRKHPVDGRRHLEKTFMKAAGCIVEQHHERLDGSGYPYGLRAEAICPEAYIIAVADSYDAMTSNRPYRRALTQQAALTELSRYAGQHYPKEVVEALLETVEVLAP